MRRIPYLLICALLLLAAGCGHETKRPDGSNFAGDIRDKSSKWSNEKK